MASLGSHINALEIALASLEEGEGSSHDSIGRVAHQLKGSGASYGIPEITHRAIDVLNASEADLGSSTRSLIGLLNELTAGTEAGKQTVLIVEDDPAIQMLLQRALESPARDIVLASTMAEGRDSISREPDLVILDLFLPDGDGRQLLTDLRRIPATSNTKVIVLSGADCGVAKAECLALGADAFLSKPFDPVSRAAR